MADIPTIRAQGFFYVMLGLWFTVLAVSAVLEL